MTSRIAPPNENLISAKDYKLVILSMYPNASKKYICRKLNITRPTHNDWLKRGITRRKEVIRIRELVCQKVTEMRQRARALDRWTTAHTIKPIIPRLT